MSYRPYFIEVSGNIIAKEGKHYTQDWVAYSEMKSIIDQSIKPIYNPNLHSFSGNLILDKNTRAVPYAFYVAKEDVIAEVGAQGDVDLVCSPGFYPAFAYFDEYIKDIRTSVDKSIDDEIKELYYNGLYVSTFSILELFLCDFLMCGVFSQKSYYENALTILKIKADSDQYKIEKSIKDTVFKVVYHRFDDIKKLFMRIFGFDFPDYRDLALLIYRRHNIVHRYSLSNRDRMSVCYASREDVLRLVETVICFVEEMRQVCGLDLSANS